MFLTRLKTRFTNCFFPNKQQIKRFEAIMNLAYKINDHDTDWVYFYRIDNKKKIAKVPNVEIAAIFEIGRIISKSCQQ